MFAKLRVRSKVLEILANVREHCSVSEKQTVCDGGQDLDAHFFVEHQGADLTVVVESAGSGPTPRNKDYDEGLRLILERLGRMHAQLQRVEVASSEAAGRPVQERTIELTGYPTPLVLAVVEDYGQLRRTIGRGAEKTARRPNAKEGGGNPQKRLRLFLSFSAHELPTVDDLTPALKLGTLTKQDRSSAPSLRRSATGQGFEANTAVRLAVEEHAMLAAVHYYSQLGWTVERCERQYLGYDILVTKGSEQLFVEVKGSTGKEVSQVIITRKEAEHARDHRAQTVLFILRNIRVTGSEEAPICEDGEPQIISKWDPFASGELKAINYFWHLPKT